MRNVTRHSEASGLARIRLRDCLRLTATLAVLSIAAAPQSAKIGN